jgi:hypothetical protein
MPWQPKIAPQEKLVGSDTVHAVVTFMGRSFVIRVKSKDVFSDKFGIDKSAE